MPTPRVAVVGPGAVGAVFAAAIQEAGRAELVVCSRRHLDQLAVERDAGTIVVRAPMVCDPAEVGAPAPWVLLAVKAHQTEGAGEWLRALARPGSVVVVLQNGVEHRARVEPLAGGAAILPAIVWSPAEAVRPGRVRQIGEAHISVPAGPEAGALVHLLAGQVRVEVVDDFTTAAWQKLCLNAVSALMALAGRRAGMYRDPEVAALARGLALECVAVGRAEGAALTDDVADAVVDGFATKSPDLGSSILYDRLAGRALEWDARNGVIRRLGVRHGIPTPISDVVVPLLAAASTAP